MRRLPSYLAGRFASAYEIEKLFNVEVMPCPFCNSRSVGAIMGPIPHVICLSCGGEGPQSPDDHKEDLGHRQYLAVTKWNQRSPLTPS